MHSLAAVSCGFDHQAIAPRQLRLDSLVDGSNRRESLEQVRTVYELAITAYRLADASMAFEIGGYAGSIAEWLLRPGRWHKSPDYR